MDVHNAPLLVYWEVTQACDLVCQHCRADAHPEADRGELNTEEGYLLLQKLAGFGKPLPHIVCTGGDPLKRRDLPRLIGRARQLGFTVAVTPSATPLLTPDAVRGFQEAGVWMLALSLDGSTAWRHDRIRGIDGTFARTLTAAEAARQCRLPLQINTLVCEQTCDDLPGIHRLVEELGAARWSLFFLVQVGRGRLLTPVDPARAERTLHWLAELADRSPLDIKTTEAPMYRRIRVQRGATKEMLRGVGIRDGCGVMFLSNRGEIFPSGFLPLSAGNVRRDDPVRVYRESRLFRALRHPHGFGGRCGRCEFNHLCGGSRARAFAATGDALSEDPLCPYDPPAREADPGSDAGAPLGARTLQRRSRTRQRSE